MRDNWNFDLHANSYKRRWQLVYQTAVPVEANKQQCKGQIKHCTSDVIKLDFLSAMLNVEFRN